MNRVHTLVVLTVLLVAGLAVVAGPAAGQDDGEINIVIEPDSAELEPGETQTYEVVVEGPDSGISAYDDVVIELSDPDVGTIVEFEEQFDEDDGFTSSNSEIRDDGATLYLEAVTGTSFADPAEEIVLATFDLEAEAANDGDTTDIEFDSFADNTVADFDNIAPYDVAALEGASMTIDIEFGAVLELASVEADDWIQLTDDLEVEYVVENVGDETGIESAVELVIDVTEPTVEDADTDVLVDPDDSESGTLVFEDVSELAPGVTIDYTVQLADFGHSVNGTANITDGEPEASVSGVDIAGQGTDATIIETQSEDISLGITNTGSLADSFDVSLEILDEAFDPVVEAETSTAVLGPADSETVVFEGVTDDLDAGPHEVQLVAGSGDDDHDFGSGDLDVQEAEPVSGLSNLDIAGQGPEAIVVEGASESITVDVTNEGHDGGTFDVTLNFFTEDGDRVGGQQEAETGSLAPGDTETLVFEDATGHLEPGVYVPEVVTSDDIVEGALLIEEPAEAESALSNLDIAGQGSTATVAEDEDASVAVEVINVGDDAGAFDVTLGIETATGQPVAGDEKSTGQLEPTESETVVFEGVTDDLDPGEYALELATADDELSGSLTVEEGAASLLSNLDIAGQGSTATVLEGESEDVTVTVTNILEAGESFGVTLQVGDEAELSQTTELLDPGQAETVTFGDVTGDIETGQYDVVAETTAGEGDQVGGTLTVATGVDVTGDGNLATDTTGDGLLNDVDGDGEFTIFDVQALFAHFGDDIVQNHPGLFNFNEDDPPSVSIFDVQALFGQLQAYGD